MRLHVGKLRRFLWDDETAVISVERDDGSRVALLVAGAVAENFISKHVATENGVANLEPIIGQRVTCEESSSGMVMKLALTDAREREVTR